jgi:hypothetical protein
LFLFADFAFPWFVYADITLETVALDTPNNVQMLRLNADLSKSVKSPIFRFFHTDCLLTQSLMEWHEHYRV